MPMRWAAPERYAVIYSMPLSFFSLSFFVWFSHSHYLPVSLVSLDQVNKLNVRRFALRTKVNTEKEENENKDKNKEHAKKSRPNDACVRMIAFNACAEKGVSSGQDPYSIYRLCVHWHRFARACALFALFSFSETTKGRIKIDFWPRCLSYGRLSLVYPQFGCDIANTSN